MFAPAHWSRKLDSFPCRIASNRQPFCNLFRVLRCPRSRTNIDRVHRVAAPGKGAQRSEGVLEGGWQPRNAVSTSSRLSRKCHDEHLLRVSNQPCEGRKRISAQSVRVAAINRFNHTHVCLYFHRETKTPTHADCTLAYTYFQDTPSQLPKNLGRTETHAPSVSLLSATTYID